jgi:hypothetical protein
MMDCERYSFMLSLCGLEFLEILSFCTWASVFLVVVFWFQTRLQYVSSLPRLVFAFSHPEIGVSCPRGRAMI